MQSPPKIPGATGLRWRQRDNGWVAVWIARPDLVKRGYEPKTQRLWPPTGLELPPPEPGPQDIKFIQSECQRLQDDMLAFSRGEATGVAGFDGTVGGLIACYRGDPDSPFQQLRFASRKTYLSHMHAIDAHVGKRALASLTSRDFTRWYSEWAADGAHVGRAYARIRMLRLLIAFGVVMELKDPATGKEHCLRLDTILGKMTFTDVRPRGEIITAEQAIAVRRRAHEVGRPSIALAQALQFELLLRSKDVFGEWVALAEPGTSDITEHGDKWIIGLHWRELTGLSLTHRLSKSLRGRKAILDPRAGKIKKWDLSLYPMIMEELVKISPEQRIGPMLIDEQTGLPYRSSVYRRLWRSIADEAGIPPEVQLRDSRAGGITEGIDATDGNLEANRHAAGHANISMTQRYSRAGDRATAKVAELRAAKRPGNDIANAGNDSE